MELNNNILNGWVSRLNNRQYSTNTIDNYYSDFNKFQDFIKSRLWTDILSEWDISLRMIEDFKTELANTETPVNSIYYQTRNFLSPWTIQSKITAIKSFLHYMNQIYDTGIEYRKIEQRRVKTPAVSVLSEEEFYKLMNWIWALEKYRINALRSQLLVDLWYTSWMRLSEMLTLKRNDIKQWRKMITWKWNKDRWVFFTDSVKSLLAEYEEERLKPIPWTWLVEKESDYVFISHNSWFDYWTPIKKNTVCGIIKKYSDELDFGKRITCHTLRHSFATRCIEAWLNIREIQELLGHADIQTTERYCHVLTSTLEDKHNKIFK